MLFKWFFWNFWIGKDWFSSAWARDESPPCTAHQLKLTLKCHWFETTLRNPGDSKWPFYPLFGGHLVFERVCFGAIIWTKNHHCFMWFRFILQSLIVSYSIRMIRNHKKRDPIFWGIFFRLSFGIFFRISVSGVEAGRKEGSNEGRKEGRKGGRKEGRKEATKEEREEGRKEGRNEEGEEEREEGRKEGRKEEMKKERKKWRRRGRKGGRKEWKEVWHPQRQPQHLGGRRCALPPNPPPALLDF